MVCLTITPLNRALLLQIHLWRVELHKAFAFINHRGYVIPEDVRAICHDVLRHRIGLTYEAEAEEITVEDIINQILNKVEVP